MDMYIFMNNYILKTLNVNTKKILKLLLKKSYLIAVLLVVSSPPGDVDHPLVGDEGGREQSPVVLGPAHVGGRGVAV